MGYQVGRRSHDALLRTHNVDSEALKATSADGPRLKFAPPKHKIIYG